jgi:hypothetical protein
LSLETHFDKMILPDSCGIDGWPVGRARAEFPGPKPAVAESCLSGSFSNPSNF